MKPLVKIKKKKIEDPELLISLNLEPNFLDCLEMTA